MVATSKSELENGTWRQWALSFGVFFRRSSEARRARIGLMLVSPAIFFFAVFYIYPLFQAFYISFFRWGLLDTPRYVGLRNYEFLLRDQEFSNSVFVTLYYVFGTVIPIWIIALGLALVFNNSFRFRGGFLTVFYLPAVISLTVWSMIWLLSYHPTYGLVSFFTRSAGFEYLRFLQDTSLAMPALILLSVWKGTPLYMVILISGLRAIPSDYYEAATVDGANVVQRFWWITMPLLRPVMLYVMVISIIEAFKVFTPMYILTGGGPGSATRVLPMFIYENAFSYLRMGYASAASIIFLLILLSISFVQFRLLRSGAEN
jgi:ABC-type sugar transport system permease subunit